MSRGPTIPPGKDTKTFLVQEGAFPWYDRVGNWSLTKVPDSLKGTGPIPQGSCSSRSLDIAGKPKSILVAVQNNDIDKFKAKMADAKATADTIAVKNTGGSDLGLHDFFRSKPAGSDRWRRSLRRGADLAQSRERRYERPREVE